MHAAVLHNFESVPRFESFPEPEPQEGEVIVHVHAAALKPIDKAIVNGSHYSSANFVPPFICGLDGVGELEDGTRVFFFKPRAPYGAMAERTVVPRSLCFPMPAGIETAILAALFNPGASAWGSLAWRGQLAAGETVLILGATGVAGQLAVQIAKLLGAGRVVAAGRNPEVLSTLPGLGADAVIDLDQPRQDLVEAFAREAGSSGYNVVIDFLWGQPTEALLAAITRHDLDAAAVRTRLVEVGESAGANISLPAAALRGSRLEILGSGTGSAPGKEAWAECFRQLLSWTASGQLRIQTEKIPLAEIEQAWEQNQCGRRFVLIP